MQKIITFVLMLFISTSAAMADPAKKTQNEGQDKFQHELSRCAAFYEILSGCLSDEDQQKKEMTALSKKTIQQAMQFGMKINMKVDKILSRLRSERATMISDIQGKCANYSVLVKQNFENCSYVSTLAKKWVKDWKPDSRGSASE